MAAFVDHNGRTTFGDHVKSWDFETLEKVFGNKHDCVKLAAHLGIKVVKAAKPKAEDKPLVKKNKED